MSDTVKNLSSFVKEVVARLKGDDAEALAQKNERKARAAIQGQISSLTNQEVEDEDRVSEAEDALAEARYPTTLISSASSYTTGLKNAAERLEVAQDKLEATRDLIEFFKAQLVLFN